MAVVLGMRDIVQLLERWQLDVGEVRERMYRASTPRERERLFNPTRVDVVDR